MTFAPWTRDEIRPYLVTSQLLVESFGRIVGVQNTVTMIAPIPGRLMARTEAFHSGPATDYGREQTSLTNVIEEGPVEYWEGRGIGPRLVVLRQPSFIAYERTGHALFAMIIGLVGGILAIFVDDRKASRARSRSKKLNAEYESVRTQSR